MYGYSPIKKYIASHALANNILKILTYMHAHSITKNKPSEYNNSYIYLVDTHKYIY